MSEFLASGNSSGDRLDRGIASPSPQEPERDGVLDALVEEFTDRMQAGEHPSIDSFVARHPERAEQLRGLLPWAQALAQVDLRADSGDGPPEDRDLRRGRAELGDFRLIRELGRGGMGVVYEAEQKSLGRRVALKILPYAAMFDARQLQRFKNEARAAATLNHPHIVSIHTVGFEQDVHFYAMQLIEGESLADVIVRWRSAPQRDTAGSRIEICPGHESGTMNGASVRGGELQATLVAAPASTADQPATEDTATRLTILRTPGAAPSFFQIARWGAEAAGALEYAHQMGIVHRDVKPSNLLVNDHGHLWVADFGLAMTAGDGGLTRTGDVPGTLRYMSPEQLRGDREQLDHRTDIYSLGVTLYELATLEPAFPVSDRVELTKRIVEAGVGSPRRLNPALPPDLDWIIRKAAERDPAERYQSARELADDLRRFLDAEPIRGRSAHPFRVAARWSRRNPRRAGVAIAGSIVFVVGLSIAAAWRARAERPTVDFQGAPGDVVVDGLKPTGPDIASEKSPADDGGPVRDAWQLGTNNFDAGYFDEAVEHLTGAVETCRRSEGDGQTSPTQKLYGVLAEANLGRVLWRMGRLEEAAPHLQAGLMGISRLDDLPIPADRDRRNAAIACFQLASFFGDLLLWEEATDCYRQGIAIAPASLSIHHELMYCACTTVASGDGEGYRQLTKRAFALYRDNNDPDVRCFVTQALCVGADPGVDREVVAQFADKPWVAPGTMDGANRFAWTVHAALAHLDAGHFSRAEELASRIGSDPTTFGIFSVIAAHRGRTNLAADLLERLECARREEARKILFSRPNETGTIEWIRFVKHQNDSARAQRALGAPQVLDNPWTLLVQGRNRAILGIRDRAERDFRQAVELARDDGDVLLARGRIYLELGWNELAARDFQRARESLPRSPKPLIAEAHAQLERGHTATAQSRFEETLSLPPDELDLFLQTDGWWLAGPYPSRIETPCPPDESQELELLTASASSPSQSTPSWRRLPSGEFGKIDLGGRLPSETGCSAYLLTYVYSPDVRKIILHVGSDGPRRVWLNGAAVHASDEPRIWEFATDHIPLELRAERNTLLVKVAGAGGERPPSQFFARFDDSPVDRARSLVGAHLFPEASREFERALRGVGTRDSSTWQLAAYAAAAAGEDSRYARLCEAIWEHDRRLANDAPYWTARTWLLRSAIPQEQERWTGLLVRREIDPNYFCPPENVRIHAALARFRLGQYDAALAEIRDLADDKSPYSWPILSLIHRALGNTGKAAEALEHAARWRRNFWKRQVTEREVEFLISWAPLAEFESLYIEAGGQTGEVDRPDDFWRRLANARRRVQFRYPLAAESDLQAAADLAGADPRAWSARAAVLVELGQLERAAADFQSAFSRTAQAADWHDLARRLARAAGFAEALGRPAERDRWQQQAIQAVRNAKEAGMKIADQLREGRELESLRDRPEFKALGD